MPALEPVAAIRVVATSDALDGARWLGDDVDGIRIAADEALGIGAVGVDLDDPDAIIESEAGVSVGLLNDRDMHDVIDHADWLVPIDGAAGTVAQGKVAGVPAKLVIGDPTLLVIQTAYADELTRRLGW